MSGKDQSKGTGAAPAPSSALPERAAPVADLFQPGAFGAPGSYAYGGYGVDPYSAHAPHGHAHAHHGAPEQFGYGGFSNLAPFPYYGNALGGVGVGGALGGPLGLMGIDMQQGPGGAASAGAAAGPNGAGTASGPGTAAGFSLARDLAAVSLSGAGAGSGANGGAGKPLGVVVGSAASHVTPGFVPGDETAAADFHDRSPGGFPYAAAIDGPAGAAGAAGANAAAADGALLASGADAGSVAAANGAVWDESALPPHACSYCGIHASDAVVRCTCCNKWFCNSKGVTNASHIVTHLVRSKHKEVALHADSPLGDTALECYSCGARNIFLLGFVPARADNVVVLLCRTPCLHSPALKDMPWDFAGWMPLIEDRRFLTWLVAEPGKEALAHARPLNSTLIARLEDMWRARPRARLQDLEEAEKEEEVEAACLQYADAYHFQNVMAPLVGLEAEYDRRTKEMQAQDGITVAWDTSSTGKLLASFCFYLHEEAALRVVPGDEIVLTRTAEVRSWAGAGTVLKIGAEGRVTLAITKGSSDAPVDWPHGYRAQLTWKSVTYDRMQVALRSLAMKPESLTPPLYAALMGRAPAQVGPPLEVSLPENLGAPGLPGLNPSQSAAVCAVLPQPVSLIQGPPGTGKTLTSATIVYHLHTQHKTQVLVCAPSNVAVDHLAEKIHATGLRVVRVASKSREAVQSSVDALSLHVLVRQLALRSEGELAQLQRMRDDNQGEMRPADEAAYRTKIRAAERALIMAADVVCTTCAGAGDPRLQSLKFRHVLIDEATQATEPECLLPLIAGARQVVLVGDHCQLGPVVMCKAAAKAGYNRSLFERLILLGHQPLRLQVQYRMHPALSAFPSAMFYDGSLQNGVSAEDRTLPPLALQWPQPEAPMFFLTSTGLEEYSGSGVSFLNRSEAANVERLVAMLFASGVRPHQIGIITPYEGQRLHLLSLFARPSSPLAALAASGAASELEVASVDSFQGREKDFVILTCVRSNEHGDVGFLSDPRRMNVALTRAKYGLVVMGNPRVLARQPLWHALLSHFKQQDLIMEGPLTALRPSAARLPQPREAVARRALRVPVGFDPTRTFANAAAAAAAAAAANANASAASAGEGVAAAPGASAEAAAAATAAQRALADAADAVTEVTAIGLGNVPVPHGAMYIIAGHGSAAATAGAGAVSVAAIPAAADDDAAAAAAAAKPAAAATTAAAAVSAAAGKGGEAKKTEDAADNKGKAAKAKG